MWHHCYVKSCCICAYSWTLQGAFCKHKMVYLVVSKKRICYLCEAGIEKPVFRITVWHHDSKRWSSRRIFLSQRHTHDKILIILDMKSKWKYINQCVTKHCTQRWLAAWTTRTSRLESSLGSQRKPLVFSYHLRAHQSLMWPGMSRLISRPIGWEKI